MDATERPDSTQRLLGVSAASLFLIALLTGIYAGAAMTGKLHVNGKTALAAHLNALMGTFLISGVGWTLPMLHYGSAGKRRLALAFILTSYANWIVTSIKAALDVGGLTPDGPPANTAVFVALQIFVVIPTFVAALAWVWGFRRRANSAPP